MVGSEFMSCLEVVEYSIQLEDVKVLGCGR
jgi:hypothetical protein